MRRILAVIAGSFLLASVPLLAAETALPELPAAAAAAPPVPAKKGDAAAAPLRVRIGYADILKVAEKSDAGKIAKAHFEAKADRHKSQIDTKQRLLEKQKATLEAKLPSYSPEQRAAKIREYEKKLDELRKLLQKADKEMKPMQEELLRDIYGKIEKAAREYGAANGFAVILEKRELLYLGSNVDAEDVTDGLIKELNKK